MSNKAFLFLLSFFGLMFFSWYTLVYSGFYKNVDIVVEGVSSKNIYLNASDLHRQLVYISSQSDVSSYTLTSGCNTVSQFLSQQEGVAVFQIDFQDVFCKNGNVYLQDNQGQKITNTKIEFKIITDFDLYNLFMDYSSLELDVYAQKIAQIKQKYKIFSQLTSISQKEFVQKSRMYQELNYTQSILENILEKREQKYLVPVQGYELPEKNLNKLPNGGRPYRASYTNAIHEGWDIDAPLGTQVRALDNGIIVNVIRNFQFGDLSALKTTGNITPQDRLTNLNILRGNQVWVKTMKGDVVFYSHLSQVYDDIQPGVFVSKGQPLGKVGKTGVPDKDYEDYHLHFELKQNPYDIKKAGAYTFLDYMAWPWYFKGESREYIKEQQYSIFER